MSEPQGAEPERDEQQGKGPDESRQHVRPQDLRVSDAEREHIVGILEKAIGQGMLGLDEFTTRTDTALAARTRGQLNIVLADLPGLHHHDAAQQRRTHSGGWNAPPTGEPQDYLELTAHYSTLKRSGRWVVPNRLLVRNKYGETSLDFTEAEVAGKVVSVELNCKWGPVTLTIPEHASVDTSGITELKWGSINNRTRSDRESSVPRYVVSGRVHGGSLTIRHPRRGIFTT